MRKTLISIALATLALAACKKDANVMPKSDNGTAKLSSIASIDSIAKLHPITKSAHDTIPDNAMFKVVLAMDSTSHDETMIMFDHTASVNYSAVNDAPYFQGFGKVSLCSISGDGKNIAIYTLPYKTGMAISLDVNAKADGNYSLALTAQKHIPENLHVWVKDAYLKDSVDVSSGGYSFHVVKADTSSFGRKRFSLVFKQVQPK
ncbi:MAG TPA: hypothetical protein VG367_05045 [Mucilaginibacter sp.]|jgi:hypothetical protein|nr:hypothetical protein [Mucilaginibacter sp.]